MTYKIYVDLDGVLADFDKFYFHNFGYYFDDIPKKQAWQDINDYIEEHGTWYSRLPKMQDADILWNYVVQYTPVILTATGKNDKAIQLDKIFWAKDNFDINLQVITVINGVDKAEYSLEGCILIDDTPKVIDAWNKGQGVGILHTSASDTISKLKELGI